MEMNYEHMTTGEIIEYYKRVKNYIEQGFRVDGLKDELHLISKTLQTKKSDITEFELDQYLDEIDRYLKNIRH